MLGTIQLKLRTKNGITTNLIRGFADTGSQINLITENCLQRNNVSKIKQKIPISGIGSASSASGYIDVELLHRQSDAVFCAARFMVVRKISTSLPERQLNPLIDVPMIINDLADPSYTEPGPIDLLIGAGLWALIVENHIVRHADSKHVILAQKTAFGWVISGQLRKVWSIQLQKFQSQHR